jgi:hypothetical protein
VAKKAIKLLDVLVTGTMTIVDMELTDSLIISGANGAKLNIKDQDGNTLFLVSTAAHYFQMTYMGSSSTIRLSASDVSDVYHTLQADATGRGSCTVYTGVGSTDVWALGRLYRSGSPIYEFGIGYGASQNDAMSYVNAMLTFDNAGHVLIKKAVAYTASAQTITANGQTITTDMPYVALTLASPYSAVILEAGTNGQVLILKNGAKRLGFNIAATSHIYGFVGGEGMMPNEIWKLIYYGSYWYIVSESEQYPTGVVTYSTNDPIDTSRRVRLADMAGDITNITFTAGSSAGQLFTLINISAHSITVATTGTSLLREAGTAITLAAHKYVTLCWDGSNWNQPGTFT